MGRSDRAGVDVEPPPDPHRAALDVHRHHGVQRRAPLLRLPRVRMLDLAALAVDLLAEISGATLFVVTLRSSNSITYMLGCAEIRVTHFCRGTRTQRYPR
jgi:hypothetical protein